jgi:hypothetical protein
MLLKEKMNDLKVKFQDVHAIAKYTQNVEFTQSERELFIYF